MSGLQSKRMKSSPVTELPDQSELHMVSDIIRDLADGMDHRRVHGVPVDVSTGFETIDEQTTFRKGETTVLAARTSVGKSALAMNFAINACAKGKSVLFVSLEMTALAMAERVLAHDASINLTIIRKGNDETLVGSLRKTADNWEGTPLRFYTPRSRLFSDIKQEAEYIKQSCGLDFLIIDYIQLVRLGGYSRSRFEEVSDLSAGFKLMAQEMDIPVLILAQLNRSADYDPNKKTTLKPRLSQLKESGALEQDADVVLLMHKLDEYKSDERREIRIAKNRQGQAGAEVVMDFEGRYQKFIETPISEEDDTPF